MVLSSIFLEILSQNQGTRVNYNQNPCPCETKFPTKPSCFAYTLKNLVTKKIWERRLNQNALVAQNSRFQGGEMFQRKLM